MTNQKKQEIEEAICEYMIQALKSPSPEHKVELVPELAKVLHDFIGVL